MLCGRISTKYLTESRNTQIRLRKYTNKVLQEICSRFSHNHTCTHALMPWNEFEICFFLRLSYESLGTETFKMQWLQNQGILLSSPHTRCHYRTWTNIEFTCMWTWLEVLISHENQMWTWFVPRSPLQIWYCCELSWSLRGTENNFASADICNCIYMRGQQHGLLFLVHWDEIECIFCMQAFQRVHSEKIFPCLEVKMLRLLPWCGSLWEIFVAPVGTMSMCVMSDVL